MPTPNSDLVRRVLAINGRDKAIHQAIDDAWRDFQERYPERAWWRRGSTRAALIWEYAVDKLIGLVDGTPGVFVVPHHDTVSFVFDDLVLVRLKKANIELQTSNVQTPLAKAFHMHSIDLFGFEGQHRVEAAYVLNPFATRMEWIGIVARERRLLLWDFPLEEDGAVVRQLPLPTHAAPAADRVVRLQVEEGARREEESE